MSAPSTDGHDRLSWFERNLGFAVLGILFAAVFLLATRTEPVRANWGDPWSDGNAMTSGRYFAEDGFIETAFTPILDVGPITETSLRYTHYPPLPDIVNGAQQSLFGPMTISQFRILADILSLLSLVFFYRFVRRLTEPAVAGYAVALLATNMLWLQYADTLHHVPLYTCFGYVALDQAGAWLARPARWRLWLLGTMVALCVLASYDFGLYVPILTAAAVWLSGRSLRDRSTWPLVGSVVLGIGAAIIVKFALIAWASGPVHLVEDLIFQFEERATAKHSSNYREGLWTIAVSRAWRFFTPLFFAMVAILAYSAWRRRKTGTAPISLRPWWFLAAGLPFCLIFSQLLVEQYHPTLQLVPFYAVGFATVIVALRRHARRAVRVAGVLVFAFLIAWQVRELVRFPKVLIAERDLHEVGAHLATRDQRRFVISNFLVDGPIRAYWRRHLVGLVTLREEEIDAYLRAMFARYGSEPIRFVEMEGAVDAAYDKLMFALLSGSRRWAWIAYPWNNRHKWRPRIGKLNDDLVKAVVSRGVLELTNARFRVYRFDPHTGDRGWARDLSDAGTELDLGDPISVRHKLYGLGPSGDGPDGRRASLLVGRDISDVRFTMQGLVDVPTARIDRRAAAQVHVLAGDDAALHVRIHGPAGASAAIELNGVAVGVVALNGAWQDVAFAVPAAALDETRRLPYLEAPDIVAFTITGDAAGPVHVAHVGSFAPPP